MKTMTKLAGILLIIGTMYPVTTFAKGMGADDYARIENIEKNIVDLQERIKKAEVRPELGISQSSCTAYAQDPRIDALEQKVNVLQAMISTILGLIQKLILK